MKIAIEKLEINATNEEVHAMSARRDNENWMLCFLTALMAMNDRSKEATPTLQPEKQSDNMQMSAEEVIRQVNDAASALKAERNMTPEEAFEKAMEAARRAGRLAVYECTELAEIISDYIERIGIPDSRIERDAMLINIMDTLNMIDDEKARTLLERRKKDKE